MGVLPCVLGCRTLRRTIQVRLCSNPLRLPGGTPIFAVSRRQFMKYSGYSKAWLFSSNVRWTGDLDNGHKGDALTLCDG
ncbi:MAG: hypothetical protein WBG24_05580 [Syntrophobacteria bacterium]